VDRDPEERREEKHRADRSPREGSPSEATNKRREGDRRRGQQVPPALEASREPSEATSIREEPFLHEEERPQDGLERPWWRRIFRGPHETPSEERRWWEFWR
jgi:hypothetical protein